MLLAGELGLSVDSQQLQWVPTLTQSHGIRLKKKIQMSINTSQATPAAETTPPLLKQSVPLLLIPENATFSGSYEKEILQHGGSVFSFAEHTDHIGQWQRK